VSPCQDDKPSPTSDPLLKPNSLTLTTTYTQAIYHAVDEWDVDMLSLSFGFASREHRDYDLFERALEHAHSRGKLVFAAASNSGANHRRAYPARHAHVICVHATGGNVQPAAFNPPPDSDDDGGGGGDNFATVGQAVECAWPRALCNRAVNPCCLAWKSGTSFATPIAAGIAAFLLQYAAETLEEIDVRLLRKLQGMRAVFKKISRRLHGFDYIAPRVHPDHLFGKTKPYVANRLSVVIQSS
jgi:subtilisin family serine protease